MEESSNNTIQVFWVILGNIMAFGFVMISSMLLSRYFDKEDYGTYKQIMYVYSSLLVVFTFGLPRAYSYFIPRVTKGEAKDLIKKTNIILYVLGVIMSLCLYFGANIISDALRNKSLSELLKLFSLVPFFMLPTMGLEGILATYKKTKFLAIYNILTKVFTLLCVVLPVVYFGGNISSAIIGFTLASFLCFTASLFLINLPLRGVKKMQSPYSYRDIFKFSLPIMGASIWGVIIISADQFFISRYFGSKVFADFANGSLELPFVGMILGATTTVLAPIFSKHMYDNNENSRAEILRLWRLTITKVIKVIYPMVVFCFCFADLIMIFLYGLKYEESGVFFQIKLVANFFTVTAYAALMLAIGGEKYYYNVHMFGAFGVILFEWIVASYFQSPYLVTLVSVLCQISRIMFMFFFICKFFNLKFKDLFPIRLAMNIIFPSILILYPIKYLVSLFEMHVVYQLITAFGLYFFLFSLWIYKRQIEYLTIINPLLKLVRK